MISKLCLWYLKILEATCRIEVLGLETLSGGMMGGFWHEDSLALNLLLRRVADRGLKPSILITADPRGDAIEKVVRNYRGRAIRISYQPGAALAAARKLTRFFESDREILGLAMDGPLGPRRRPKRLPFLMGAKAACGFRGIGVEYSQKLRLKSRWDQYVIPLPFSTIRFRVHDFGLVRAEEVADFEQYSQKIRLGLAAEANGRIFEANPSFANPDGLCR